MEDFRQFSEKNIPFESKREIIHALTFIEDEETKDFLFDLINDETENPYLKAEALITLTHLSDERIAPYWVKILQGGEFPINIGEINKLVINLPYIQMTPGILFIVERVISLRLNSLLRELIPEIEELDWIEKFPFLRDILTVQINEEDSDQFSQFLKSKNIDLDQGKTFSIKKKSKPSRRSISFMSVNYIRIPSLHDFYKYLQDKMIQEITPFAQILKPILNRNPKKIDSIIRNSENKLLLLVFVLCLKKYPKKLAISLLIAITDDKTNPFPIRKAAFKSLLNHFAVFPELLSPTQSDNFHELELLEIIHKLNPQSMDSQELALRIHSKTQNIRLKLYSSLKCGNNKLMIDTIEAIYPLLTHEKDILLVNDLIINYKIISLLNEVLNHLISCKSHNIKNNCIKVLKKLNTEDILISLYHAYHVGKITNIPDYELEAIFKDNLSKKLLKEIIELTPIDFGTFDKKFLLKLLIKLGDIEFWNDIMNILEETDLENVKYELSGIEEFIPHVNLEKLESMYEKEKNVDNCDYLLNLLIYSGKRKYVKEWLKINEKTNFKDTRGILVMNTYQQAVIDGYVSNLSNIVVLQQILKKIYWRKDLIAVDLLARLKARISKPELSKIIEDELMNNFSLIY